MEYKIGHVAQRLGLSGRRIREYEKAGLVNPRRQARTGDRLYSESDIRQLQRFVDLVHHRGFTLASLQALLRFGSCWTLTGCTAKSDCPAFQRPDLPCYELVGGAATCGEEADACERCPIYHARATMRAPLVEQTRPRGEESRVAPPREQ